MVLKFVKSQRGKQKHLHEPDMKQSEQLKVSEKMKEKAANSNKQPRKIVQDTTATITRECAVALPKYKSLARSIQRQRGWGKNPTTLKDKKSVPGWARSTKPPKIQGNIPNQGRRI